MADYKGHAVLPQQSDFNPQGVTSTLAVSSAMIGADEEGTSRLTEKSKKKIRGMRSSIVDHCDLLPRTRAEFEIQQQQYHINLQAAKPVSRSLDYVDADWERFLAQVTGLLRHNSPADASDGAVFDD